MIYGHQIGYPCHKELSDMRAVCRLTTDNLRELKKQGVFDSIVVRGNSGVLVGSVVALRLNVPLIVIRKFGKGGEDCHSSKHINIRETGQKPLFLDDFVASGSTRKACQAALKQVKKSLVYQYEYRHHIHRPLTEQERA